MPSTKTLAAALAVVGATTGVVGWAQYDKAVALTVDGQRTEIHALGSTVADVLSREGISLGEHDVVTPAASAEVADGAAIEVKYGRRLSVDVDGVRKDYWTTATTIEGALAEVGLRTDGAALSVSRSQPLGRSGAALTVSTPKKVTLVVDGASTPHTSTARTAGQVLTEAGITLGSADEVFPAADALLRSGTTVRVQRVVTKTTTLTTAIAHPTTTVKDATKFTDQKTVKVKGVDGVRTTVRREGTLDGALAEITILSSTVTKTPITEVVIVGTKKRPVAALPSAGNVSGAGLNLANAAMWDRIARCESSGNWHINTGNGYYGGLQFSFTSWLSNGGADFAGRADLASREQQITVANRYYAKAGLRPWGCAWAA